MHGSDISLSLLLSAYMALDLNSTIEFPFLPTKVKSSQTPSPNTLTLNKEELLKAPPLAVETIPPTSVILIPALSPEEKDKKVQDFLCRLDKVQTAQVKQHHLLKALESSFPHHVEEHHLPLESSLFPDHIEVKGSPLPLEKPKLNIIAEEPPSSRHTVRKSGSTKGPKLSWSVRLQRKKEKLAAKEQKLAQDKKGVVAYIAGHGEEKLAVINRPPDTLRAVPPSTPWSPVTRIKSKIPATKLPKLFDRQEQPVRAFLIYACDDVYPPQLSAAEIERIHDAAIVESRRKVELDLVERVEAAEKMKAERDLLRLKNRERRLAAKEEKLAAKAAEVLVIAEEEESLPAIKAEEHDSGSVLQSTASNTDRATSSTISSQRSTLVKPASLRSSYWEIEEFSKEEQEEYELSRAIAALLAEEKQRLKAAWLAKSQLAMEEEASMDMAVEKRKGMMARIMSKSAKLLRKVIGGCFIASL